MQELAPGSRYGSFQITNKLGSGLTGPVYRAVYLKDGTHVALKFLEQRDASVKSYFFNEMGLLRRAKEHERNHQHLVEYVASYTTQEPYCLATRFYEDGQELTAFLRKGIVPGLALRIVEQTAGALDYLHYGHPDKPVIHRDIKPANLMVNPAGDVLVIDLSAARHPNFMLENERGLGTPQYMPPEQYLGDEQPQTDQFALAMVAFQMLTGKTLLGSNTDHESKQMAALRDGGYARVRDGMRGMPAVAEVIVRAVAFDWRLRYPTCEEFAYELHRALASDGVSLDMVVPEQSQSGGKQRIGYAAMAAVAVVALGVLFANPFGDGGTSLPPTIVPTSVSRVADAPTRSITFNASQSDSGPAIVATTGLLPTTTSVTGTRAGGRVTSAGCALRESPSTGAKVLSSVPKGVALVVLEVRDKWYNVQIPDKTSGWCPDSQISLGGTTAPAAVAPRPPAPRPAATQPPPEQPTAWSYPPTAIPEPPTAIPEPSTATPEPPTAIPEPPTAIPEPPTAVPEPRGGGGGGGGGGGSRPAPRDR